MDKSEEYQVLLQKSNMEIGWYVKENILKFNILKSYSLPEGEDITFEIIGFMASKMSTKLLFNMKVPGNFTKEIIDYKILNFLYEKGIKFIAYVHHDAISYSPFESFNVPVFGTEADAISWLRSF